jgi:sulfur carrier protein
MIIELNGRPVELPADATLADAVAEAGANGEKRGVAAAVDGEVVRSAEWERTRLRSDQKVEVVGAVQGG